jgi:hypothetical protein
MYKSFYAVFYNLYNQSEGDSPHYTSVLLVSLCQLLLGTWIVIIIEYLFDVVLLSRLTQTVPPYLIAAIFVLLNYFWFNKERCELIIVDFDKKPQYIKSLWKVFAWGSVFIPLIMFPIVFTKW